MMMEMVLMMKLNAIGLDIRHIGDFCIDRPNGSGDSLLVIFKTDALLTLNGREITVPPDSAVLYGVGEQQFYKTICRTYVNHFLHFDGLGTDGFYPEIPFHTLLKLNNIEQVEELLRMISREQISLSPRREQCIDMLIKMLMFKLMDGISDTLPQPKNQHAAGLNSLRADIYSNAGQFSSIEQLAARLNISPQHFQQLYKKQFGISCYEDLLTAKMKMAQYYLSTTTFSIKEIAALCGYENDVCFMRRFKNRTGFTPSEYRGKVSGRERSRNGDGYSSPV